MTSARIDPTDSAVVVRVPAADPVVAAHRARLDPSAAWGVPAHVTVLYPFVDPANIDDDVLDRVAAIAAATEPFVCSFGRIGWFGDRVVYLSPDPAAPFHELTDAHAEAFPDYPPYGGAFGEAGPHLTIGEGAHPGAMRAAAGAVLSGLPLEVRVDRISVMVGAYEPASWHVIAELRLGTDGAASTDPPARPRG